jgi:hypothetical protein
MHVVLGYNELGLSSMMGMKSLFFFSCRPLPPFIASSLFLFPPFLSCPFSYHHLSCLFTSGYFLSPFFLPSISLPAHAIKPLTKCCDTSVCYLVSLVYFHAHVC